MRSPSLVAGVILGLAGTLLAASAAPGSEAASLDWELLPRLTDVRHEGAADLTETVAGRGAAAIDLPFAVNVQGRRTRVVAVGPGWLRFVPDDEPDGAPSSSAGAALEIDALAGDDIAFGPLTKVLATVAPDGLAIRWVALQTPLGPATVEALVDRASRVTLQHLSLPRGADRLRVRAGSPDSPLQARPATSRRASLAPTARLVPPVPGPAAMPKHLGPPPAGCVAESETWCDRADGPGTSEVWLSEGFDDLQAAARGWTSSGLWHPVSYATCPPGASFNPGGSMYFGVDGACTYDPSSAGSLFSPPIGPVTAGSQFIFSSRYQFESGPDVAQVWVNGTLIGGLPAGLDPALWYNFNPIDLSPWAGTMVQIEFRFSSDATVEALGWFLDDVIAWNPNVGNADCIKNAGHGQFAGCADREHAQWTFNEGRFCAGCIYTFYVLVECGREMHVPLEDIEGVDLQVSNVVDPTAPPALHCVNQTARADAGLGAYPGFYVGDANGRALDCCAPAGPEAWWGPPFDVTDGAGPGRVSWGLADGCPAYIVYDTNGNGVECAELPATCGGLLSAVSPGEEQVVDCFIQDPVGLCGLYRIDVISGGNVWNLFANCVGNNVPQFPIFFDCTEAWAAYDPLPEMAVANLVVQGTCPDLTVDFDVVNLGCQEHPGDVVARIEVSGADASCGIPPTIVDEVVPGPIAPGDVRHVTKLVAAPCSPARVAVSVDPDDLVAECTETPGAAACRTDVGLDTITSFTCGCTAQLVPDAGADEAGCSGDVVRLDASGSTISPCAAPQYRWLDETGRVLRDWSASATYDALVRCPTERTYTLEVSCQGEPCVDSDAVTVRCIQIAPDAGADVRACTGDSVTLDGSASVLTNCVTPIFRFFDPLGNEVRGWLADPTLVLPAISCSVSGDWLVEVGCAGETCSNYDFVNVQCVQVLADAGPDLSGCEGIPVPITGAGSSATGCSSVVYQWVDTAGRPLSGVLTDPDFSVTITGCPGLAQVVLLAACADPGFETCGTFDIVDIACGNPPPPVPAFTPECGRVQLDCGAAEPGVSYWWDADVTVDADLDGDPANDRDVPSCLGAVTPPDSTTRTARAWAEDALGCRSLADLDVAPLPGPAVPAPTAEPGCAGADSLLHCGSTEPTISWDLDIASDSDGNTVPDDDIDATTCDVAAPYPAGDTTARVTATAAGGCSSSADLAVSVSAGTAPAEVVNDRATRRGSAVVLTWDATPGAATYRVSRGTIGAHYDHAAGPPSGGACDTGAVTAWSDPDDAIDGGDWYYLVTAVDSCGLEGRPGRGHDGVAPFERDPRAPTPGCP